MSAAAITELAQEAETTNTAGEQKQPAAAAAGALAKEEAALGQAPPTSSSNASSISSSVTTDLAAASDTDTVVVGANVQKRNSAVGKVDSLLDAAAHGGFMSEADLAATRLGHARPEYIGDPSPPAEGGKTETQAAAAAVAAAAAAAAGDEGHAESHPPPPPPTALQPDDELDESPPPPSAPHQDDVDTAPKPPPPSEPHPDDESSTSTHSGGAAELNEYTFLHEFGFVLPSHLQCDKGHHLHYKARVEYPWYCDRCETHYGKGSPVVTCPHVGECEYDICEDCCREACVQQHAHDAAMPYVVGAGVLPLTSGDEHKQHPWPALALVGDAAEFHSEKEVSM